MPLSTSLSLLSECTAPCSEEDLGVVLNKRKIREVKEWLQQRCSGSITLAQGVSKSRTFPVSTYNSPTQSGVLLLTGPSGCGKSSVVHVLAKTLNLDCVEWRPGSSSSWVDSRVPYGGIPTLGARRFGSDDFTDSDASDYDDILGPHNYPNFTRSMAPDTRVGAENVTISTQGSQIGAPPMGVRTDFTPAGGERRNDNLPTNDDMRFSHPPESHTQRYSSEPVEFRDTKRRGSVLRSSERYISKLEEFEMFVSRSKYPSLPLRPAASSAGAAKDLQSSRPAQKLIVLDDLPFAGDDERRRRLATAVRHLASSSRCPVVVMATLAEGEGVGVGGGRWKAQTGQRSSLTSSFSAKEATRDLLETFIAAGAHCIALSPATPLAISRLLKQVAMHRCKPSPCLSPEQITRISEASGGDIRSALHSFQMAHLLASASFSATLTGVNMVTTTTPSSTSTQQTQTLSQCDTLAPSVVRSTRSLKLQASTGSAGTVSSRRSHSRGATGGSAAASPSSSASSSSSAAAAAAHLRVALDLPPFLGVSVAKQLMPRDVGLSVFHAVAKILYNKRQLVPQATNVTAYGDVVTSDTDEGTRDDAKRSRRYDDAVPLKRKRTRREAGKKADVDGDVVYIVDDDGDVIPVDARKKRKKQERANCDRFFSDKDGYIALDSTPGVAESGMAAAGALGETARWITQAGERKEVNGKVEADPSTTPGGFKTSGFLRPLRGDIFKGGNAALLLKYRRPLAELRDPEGALVRASLPPTQATDFLFQNLLKFVDPDSRDSIDDLAMALGYLSDAVYLASGNRGRFGGLAATGAFASGADALNILESSPDSSSADLAGADSSTVHATAAAAAASVACRGVMFALQHPAPYKMTEIKGPEIRQVDRAAQANAAEISGSQLRLQAVFSSSSSSCFASAASAARTPWSRGLEESICPSPSSQGGHHCVGKKTTSGCGMSFLGSRGDMAAQVLPFLRVLPQSPDYLWLAEDLPQEWSYYQRSGGAGGGNDVVVQAAFLRVKASAPSHPPTPSPPLLHPFPPRSHPSSLPLLPPRAGGARGLPAFVRRDMAGRPPLAPGWAARQQSGVNREGVSELSLSSPRGFFGGSDGGYLLSAAASERNRTFDGNAVLQKHCPLFPDGERSLGVGYGRAEHALGMWGAEAEDLSDGDGADVDSEDAIVEADWDEEEDEDEDLPRLSDLPPLGGGGFRLKDTFYDGDTQTDSCDGRRSPCHPPTSFLLPIHEDQAKHGHAPIRRGEGNALFSTGYWPASDGLGASERGACIYPTGAEAGGGAGAERLFHDNAHAKQGLVNSATAAAATAGRLEVNHPGHLCVAGAGPVPGMTGNGVSVGTGSWGQVLLSPAAKSVRQLLQATAHFSNPQLQADPEGLASAVSRNSRHSYPQWNRQTPHHQHSPSSQQPTHPEVQLTSQQASQPASQPQSQQSQQTQESQAWQLRSQWRPPARSQQSINCKNNNATGGGGSASAVKPLLQRRGGRPWGSEVSASLYVGNEGTGQDWGLRPWSSSVGSVHPMFADSTARGADGPLPPPKSNDAGAEPFQSGFYLSRGTRQTFLYPEEELESNLTAKEARPADSITYDRYRASPGDAADAYRGVGLGESIDVVGHGTLIHRPSDGVAAAAGVSLYNNRSSGLQFTDDMSNAAGSRGEQDESLGDERMAAAVGQSTQATQPGFQARGFRISGLLSSSAKSGPKRKAGNASSSSSGAMIGSEPIADRRRPPWWA